MIAKVSIVVPLFNSEPWIERTIDSALSQDYPESDLIVIDDGSSDASVDVVKKFGSAVCLETGPNKGACHARNRGLALARERGSKYVLFLDADDYLEGDIVSGGVEQATQYAADMILSNMHIEYQDQSRELRPLYTGHVDPEEFFEGWMAGNYVNPSGILWDTAFVTQIGGWDESLARAQDLEITLRALLSDPTIRKNEKGAAIHAQVNSNSISKSQSREALSSRYRAVLGLVEKVQNTQFSKFDMLLYREVYHIGRAAFRAGYIDLGREIVNYLKNVGYRKHPGTALHRLVAGGLGLERKVKLWKG